MAVTSRYHRTTIIKRPLFCNILTSLDMWPLSVGITTSINFQMTLALAKLEPCGLCSRKFTGSHEGNKMDVIGSFDHSFIIESRRERLHATHNLSKQSGPPTKSCWNLLREFSETSCSFGHKSVEYRHFHPKNRNFHVLCNQMEWSPWKATELEGCLLCLCVDRKNIHYFTQLFVNKFPQRCIEFICQGLFCQWNLRIFKQTVVFLLTWLDSSLSVMMMTSCGSTEIGTNWCTF